MNRVISSSKLNPPSVRIIKLRKIIIRVIIIIRIIIIRRTIILNLPLLLV